MTPRLTPPRHAVLHGLADWPHEAAPDARDLGKYAPPRVSLKGEWATPHLRWLEKQGYAEKLGVTFCNSRTWRITDAGRAALAAVKARGGA